MGIGAHQEKPAGMMSGGDGIDEEAGRERNGRGQGREGSWGEQRPDPRGRPSKATQRTRKWELPGELPRVRPRGLD